MLWIPGRRTHGHLLQKLKLIEKAVPGKARLALQLVGHPREVEKAMAYVFGDVIVCDDAVTAKAVTFGDGIRVRSVTLDGDVYDPSGTLSGGAPPQSSGILVKAQQLQELKRRLKVATNRLNALLQAEERDQGKRAEWKRLVHDVDLADHEVRLLEEQLNGSNATRVCCKRITPCNSCFLT